jgi:thioredoxin 1
MEISSVDLQEKIKEGKKIIVEFWAPWCGPCRMMKPVFEKVAKDNTTEVEMYTMDVDLNRDIAMSLGIRSIPTVKVFSEGQILETVVGVLNEDQIKGKVKELING